MAKVMLVEDDNNLREIYEARLQAEGYTIVAAQDGEEALVLAKAEKPDLIISDVMMPKISGFEMLDILRNTEGLKEVKVIMLTALGQSDDQQRADHLGADRYLVKSQVTLEDIVKVSHELIGDTPAPAASAEPAAASPSAPEAPTPAAPAATPVPDSTKVAPPTPTTTIPVATEPSPEPVAAPAPPTPTPAPTPAPSPPATPVNTDSSPASQPEPTDDKTTPPAVPATDIAAAASQADDSAQSTAQEEAAADTKIENFVAGATQEATPPAVPTGGAVPDDNHPEAESEPSPEPATESPATPSDETPQEEPEKIIIASPNEASADDKLVSDTAEKLVASTEASASQEPPAVIEPAPTEETPAADKPDKPGINTGSVPIAHKKVIAPLEDTNPKKDLDTLLALEAAKEAGSTVATPTPIIATNDKGIEPTLKPESPAVTPSAGQTVVPTGGQLTAPSVSAPSPADPVDPSSIAL